MKEKLLRTEVIVLLVAAILLVSFLIIKPIIGVADNGDFYRIMTPVGLSYLTQDPGEMFFGYIHRLYSVADIGLWAGGDYFTTHLIPLKLSISLDKIVRNDGIFDIRNLSVIYILILLISLYLIVKYNQYRIRTATWILAVLAVIVFVDTGYTAYFNSLYGEAPSFVFLLLTLGLFIYMTKTEKPYIIAMVAFFIAATMFIGAKQSNVPCVVFLLPVGIRLLWLRKDSIWRGIAVACMVIMLLVSGLVYGVISEEIQNINIHQAVFFGILKDSPTPEKDLQELGIDTKLAVLAGKTYYDDKVPYPPKDPLMKQEFFSKISYGKIIKFYITHPLRLYKAMERSANNGFQTKQGYLGNYEKDSGNKAGQLTNTFSLWSFAKKAFFPHTFSFVGMFFLVFAGIWVYEYRKREKVSEKIFMEMFMAIALIGATQFAIPYIADGEGDLSKHMFMFNLCFDIMAISMAVWFVHLIIQRQQRLRELYGVTQ